MFRSLCYMIDDFLQNKLEERRALNAFRSLRTIQGAVDFCSNDYLGLASTLKPNAARASEIRHGSTGSRLLSGNYPLIEDAEQIIAAFHDAPSGLLFNSGYDANIGLLSSVPQRGDTILYDYLSHASIRDGIHLSFAESFSFRHNDLNDLEEKLRKSKGHKFVVTESVFSMDGDQAPLQEINQLCNQFGANLIIDEAHATGVVGDRGEGLVQSMNLQSHCFTRIHTFGKALGCHGAIILGSQALRNYLINFSRPFIYTTALPESSMEIILTAYSRFPGMVNERQQLRQLISQFQQAELAYTKLKSNTAVQGIIVPGNEEARLLATLLQSNNLDVRPILYPTVPKKSERLRIVFHAFNTKDEVNKLIGLLQ